MSNHLISTNPRERLIDRELSWLAFNERVLELAEDISNPLLERCRYLAIFSSNLDDFFMIRVATLKRKLESNELWPGTFKISEWFKALFKKEINRIYPLLRLPDGPWRRLRTKKWLGVRTFNLAVWKKDFYEINGFDEKFEGWGHEDADLAIRLINNSIHRKDGQFALPVLHLWHAENDRSKVEANINYLSFSINSKNTKAINSILNTKADK